MSIAIEEGLCRGCRACQEACPGGLIAEGPEGKAFMRYPSDCWGCAACLKACPEMAISLYLAPELGGRGAVFKVRRDGEGLEWLCLFPDGGKKAIRISEDGQEGY
jgi:adenylylsulfate reductase subunit B